jgi:5'-3' exonuclease
MKKRRRLLVVDAMNLVFRAYYALVGRARNSRKGATLCSGIVDRSRRFLL